MFRRGRIVNRRVVADQHHLDALKSHHTIGLAPTAIVADRQADHAAERLDDAEAIAGLEIALLEVLELSPRFVFGVTRQMYLAVFRNDCTALVDKDRRVVAMDGAILDRQLPVAEAKADPDFAGEDEQRLRLRPRHLALEKTVDLRLILHIPAREERRQRQFRIDNQIASVGSRLAHQVRQARHHLRPGVIFCDRAELARRDIDKSHSKTSFIRSRRGRRPPAPGSGLILRQPSGDSDSAATSKIGIWYSSYLNYVVTGPRKLSGKKTDVSTARYGFQGARTRELCTPAGHGDARHRDGPSRAGRSPPDHASQSGLHATTRIYACGHHHHGTGQRLRLCGVHADAARCRRADG